MNSGDAASADGAIQIANDASSSEGAEVSPSALMDSTGNVPEDEAGRQSEIADAPTDVVGDTTVEANVDVAEGADVKAGTVGDAGESGTDSEVEATADVTDAPFTIDSIDASEAAVASGDGGSNDAPGSGADAADADAAAPGDDAGAGDVDGGTFSCGPLQCSSATQYCVLNACSNPLTYSGYACVNLGACGPTDCFCLAPNNESPRCAPGVVAACAYTPTNAYVVCQRC